MAGGRRFALVVTIAVLALAPAGHTVGSQPALTIGSYELVSVRPVTRKVHEVTYRARLTNTGPALAGATAVATSRYLHLPFSDDTLSFGPVPAGGSVLSSDTFTFQIPANAPVKWADIVWQISPAGNRPPAADAGPDQTTTPGSIVTLDGSGSTDADGDPLTYEWIFVTIPAGSGASLADAATPAPTFVADRPGRYTVQLIVHDGISSSSPDLVVISTGNSTPVASAGADRTAAVGETVTLDGSGSSDADGDRLAFSWALISRPAASGAALSNPAAVGPTFVADVPGQYVVQLIVNDGLTDSLPDSVVISTVNTPPVASAGADRTVAIGGTVTLDGSGSTDVDGDPLTYAWALVSAPSGSAAALDDPTAVMPAFAADRPGTYVAQLTVSDGQAASAPDTVTITTENSRPVASAGPDRTVAAGQLVVLDGSGSADIDGDPLTYRWAILAAPDGSAAALNDAASPGPSFVVDRPGTFVVQLIVNDGTVDSEPDSVTITTTNSAPVADAGPDQLNTTVGQVVVLDGTGSTDADGHPLTFAWSLLTGPPGSSAALTAATSAAPSFTPDVAGDYVAQLIVHDGFTSSAPDTVLIRAAPAPGSGISVTGGTVSAGDTIAGAVVLADPAAADLIVALASSAAGVASVPPHITVAAGEQQAFFGIEGLAGGTATIVATAAGVGSAEAAVTVTERGFDFGRELESINAGTAVEGTIRLREPAPAGGARVRVESEHPGTLAVQQGVVTIAAGEHEGTFGVAGVAPGTARLVATAEAGVHGQSARYVGVAAAPSDATATSFELIEAAREAGALGDEQALLYRIYAAFDSPALPAAYRGRTGAQIDTRLGVEINERWASLSAATQAAIVPFTMPPIYEGSWGDPASAVNAAAPPAGALSRLSTDITTLDEHSPHPCGTIGPNNPIPLRAWAKFVTPHFNFWYRTEAVPWNAVGPEQAAEAAGNLAAIGEAVYASLTTVMGREPLPDAGVPCNGGDGRLDVYIERNSPNLVAQVVPYPGACAATPGFMWVKGERVLNIEDAIAIFAHEFMHLIQLAYAKAGSCEQYGWIDEATAVWAIEHVDHGNDFEHRYFEAAFREPGEAGGSRRDLTEIAIPLDKGVNRPRETAFCNGSGYCDYPFFLYLAKRFGAGTIARTHQGTEGLDPIAAVEYGANQGSLRSVWHDYSLALYNDHTNSIAQSFHGWDDLVDGIRRTSIDQRWDEPASIEVTLDGAPSRGFIAEAAEALGNRDPRNPGNSPIYRLSTRAISYRITDPSVNYITLQNITSALPTSDLKLWAIQRINGTWREPEDWTRKSFAIYCRDVDDERLEELVLIYSNGNSTSREQDPQWLVELDPNNSGDEQSLLPQFRASNAGCFRWTGTTTVTDTSSTGLVYESTATVTFERIREDPAPDGLPGIEFFKTVSGTATVRVSGQALDGCFYSVPTASGPIAEDESRHFYILDSPDHPLDRSGTGGAITTIQNAHLTITCGDQVTFDGPAPINSTWLAFPQEGARFGDDGRTLVGSATTVAPGGITRVATWNLRAERQ